MMDIRRAAALLLALVMIAALTVGCGKKQSDTPTDTPAAGADGRTPAQQPAKLVCYNRSVTLRFVREEDTWYWGDDRDFPLEQSIVTELLATVQGYAALSPLPPYRRSVPVRAFGHQALHQFDGHRGAIPAPTGWGRRPTRDSTSSRRTRRMPCISPPRRGGRDAEHGHLCHGE